MKRLLGLLPVLLLIAARAAPDLGPVTLDRAAPVVDTVIAGVPARLAVVPDSGLDLAPAFAARLPVDWQGGRTLDIGRVSVPVREGAADVAIGGVTRPMEVRSAGLPCCRGLDGTIGAVELPWSTVRLGTGATERRFATAYDARTEFNLPQRVAGDTIHIVLAPDNPETVATAAAAAILARTYGGHLEEAVRQVPILFGVARPVRDMSFDRPVPLLGFTVRRIAVRIGDFAGDAHLLDFATAAQPDADAIVVRHRPPPPQYRWTGVTIGRDLLDRCPAIAWYRATREIGLSCD